MYMLSTNHLETLLISSSRDCLSFFTAKDLNSLKKKKMNRKWANLGPRVKKKIKATMKKGLVVGEVKV